MKHHLITAIIMALSLVPATLFAQNEEQPYDFSAENEDGVTIYYNILSEEEKTCEVTFGIMLGGYYSGDIVIPSLANGYKVTSIDDNTFYSSDITSITIPNTITAIKSNTFAESKELETVIIGDAVKTIGECAFQNCQKLKNLIIGKSVSDIHSSAFNDCNNISYLELNMSTVGDWFRFNRTIGKVVIGDNVKSIGAFAFEGCDRLESVDISESVTSIGENAFWACSFQSVDIPTSVTSIGDGAFGHCIALKSVTIPNSVKSIGNMAFFRCWGLTSITIPNSVTSIGESAFFECGRLETVCIGSGVKTIGERAFDNCPIVSIEINAPIVGRWFYGTAKTVILGENVKEIGPGAFSNYGSLKTINIPNSVTSIGDNAFSGCSLLQSIEIPSSVTSIGNNAFENCGITSIDIPATVTDIGYGVFMNCSSLASVTIPNSIISIKEGMFQNCTSLTEIELPNSIDYIGPDAFYNCKELVAVEIPKSVNTISGNPFEGCSSLESIIVEEGNEKYNSADRCNAIIETSSGTLIKGCANTVIPKNIKAIGFAAFSGCVRLSSVTIPNSVTSIGNAAFYGCTSLSTVYSEITRFFDIDKSVFKGSENTTLYVPKGMGNFYRASTGWSVIKYIEEMPDDTPDASFLISCSNKGSVSINGSPSITNKIASSDINEGTDNTFTFTPKPNCRLDQVILNGLNITANVVNNTLTCTIPANSQMIVTFTSEQGDMNNDGHIDISDVVAIVNKILGD